MYHILNRANSRLTLFRKAADYEAFECVLEEACERFSLPVLTYCVMPNHWHFLVWPPVGQDRLVSEFFRWLTVTHTQRWHAHQHTSGTGHLYQGRFKAFPIQEDERNPLRTNLVARAEDWRFGGLARRRKKGTGIVATMFLLPEGAKNRLLLCRHAVAPRAERQFPYPVHCAPPPLAGGYWTLRQ